MKISNEWAVMFTRLAISVSITFLFYSIYADAAEPVQSSSEPSLSGKDAAGAFVQDFYDWYAPMGYRQKNSLPWEQAITLKPDKFSVKLKIAMNIDRHSGKGADGTYTALDVDPFLNSFNPCEHYVVNEVLEYEKSYRVALQPICDGKLRQKIVVWAEVAQNKKMQWTFVNFHYPEGNDLFDILKKLRARRRSDLD